MSVFNLYVGMAVGKYARLVEETGENRSVGLLEFRWETSAGGVEDPLESVCKTECSVREEYGIRVLHLADSMGPFSSQDRKSVV